MSHIGINRELTRRQFLKTTGALAAVAAVGAKFDAGSKLVGVANATGAAAPTVEEVRTICRMCHTFNCATVVEVRDGVAVKLMGDKEGPFNQGALCIRGLSSLMNLYNPYRVRTPLKRSNPKKGFDQDPKWVEITWDEALNTVADKLNKVRTTDPRGYMPVTGFGRDGVFLSEFTTAFGTPNGVGTSGSMCSNHFTSMHVHGTFLDRTDAQRCKYLLSVGRSTGPNFGEAEGLTMDIFGQALKDGMKLVVVDPRCSIEASKAAEWIPIRPGTDLAFFLSMMNVMLHELNKFDVVFVKQRTNGSYLIGPDGDYVRDAASKKPLIWDPKDAKAKAFDDASIKDYALEGTFEVDGKKVTPSFQMLKTSVAAKTPEWAEKITSIPAATIRRITSEFVEAAQIGSTVDIDGFTFPLRPAAVQTARGLHNHKNGQVAFFAGAVLNMLIGSLDVPGGKLGTGVSKEFLAPDADGTVKPPARSGPAAWKWPLERTDLGDFFPFRHTMGFLAPRVIVDPKKYMLNYEVQIASFHGANFYSTLQEDNIAEALAKIPFTFTFWYSFDEPTQFADIVLPEHSVLERYVLNDTPAGSESTRPKLVNRRTIGLWGMLLAKPVVKPIYNSRQSEDVYIDLAARMGILDGKGGMNDRMNARLKDPFKFELSKTYNSEDFLDRLFKSTWGEGKGLDYFKKNVWIVNSHPEKESFNYYWQPGNKTRHTLYRIQLKRGADRLRNDLKTAGVSVPGWDMNDFFFYYNPLPDYKPNPTDEAPSEFDLYAIVWRTPPFMFDISGVQGNPWLFEIEEKLNPYAFNAWLNSATAQKKGLKDGDTIEVKSHLGGKTTATVKITELIHPEVIGFAGGFARLSKQLNSINRFGPNFNMLLSARDGMFDPLTGCIENTPRVKVNRV